MLVQESPKLPGIGESGRNSFGKSTALILTSDDFMFQSLLCCTMLHHPLPNGTILYRTVPYCTALCLISTQCRCLNMGLSGVIAGWICIRAGPRSRLLQGAFLQQLIVKTRTSLDLFWGSRIMSGKVQWQS